MNTETGVENLFTTIAESVLETPDSQILREVEEAGEEPRVAASRVREVLLGAVKAQGKAAQKTAMAAAWEEYHQQVSALREKRFVLPSTIEDKRKLLQSVFQRFPQMQSTFLTVQHRDFKELSDADIESYLKQLRALGVFGDGEK